MRGKRIERAQRARTIAFYVMIAIAIILAIVLMSR